MTHATGPIEPGTVAALLDSAADLLDRQGLVRHEAWTERGAAGPLGAETAILVAATGAVMVRPLPTVVHAAVEACSQVLCGNLDCWADNAANDADEVSALMRHTATHLREVTEQERAEVAGTYMGDLLAERARWADLCMRHRSAHATRSAVA